MTPATNKSIDLEPGRRREILDAAHRCIDRFGIRRTRIEDVAELAGISRPLVYRYFSNKEELIDAVLLDGVRSTAQRLAPRIAEHETFEEAIVEGSVLLVTAGRNNPTPFTATGSIRAADLPATIARHSNHIRTMAVDVWHPVHTKARANGEVRDSVDEEQLSDWLACVHLMFLLRPDIDEDEIRHYMKTFVVPALVPPSVQKE